METLSEVREYIKTHRTEGVDCPACDQFAKEYDRSINSAMAYALIQLYKLDQNKPDYYHISQIEAVRKSGGGDFAQLRYWGLVVEQENETTEKRTSGAWAITEAGRDFVLGRRSVPKYMKLYNGAVIGMSQDQTIDIKDALGKKFNYFDLMGFNPGDVRPKGVLAGQERLI